MKELLLKRAKVFESARAIVLKAETEQRALTAEERQSYDAHMADVKAFGETIERSRQSAEMDAQLNQSVGPNPGTPAGRGRNPGSDLADAAMDGFIRRGTRGLSTEQRGVFGMDAMDPREHIILRAASPLSDVTGAAGAYTVPQGFMSQLDTALLAYCGIRPSRAQIVRTTSGNPLPWPTTNDTGNTGELLGEDTAVSQAVTEMAFGQILFNAYTYSSKLVLVPIQLIQDSAFDVQQFVAAALGTRLGRVQNVDMTTGDGNSKPNGLITAATSGLTTASATAITYGELSDLEHSVEPAYRIGAEFMFCDSTAGYLEKLVDGNGRPLLNSTLQGISGEVSAGKIGQARYTIKGYPVVINTAMDAIAATKKTVAFGDMSKYKVREALDMMLVRFGEKYMDKAQIGFVAFQRVDGDLVDAATHPVKFITQHA